MNIDWQSELYDPIYTTLGSAAFLRPAIGGVLSVTVLDKTSGVEVTSGASVDVGTIQPAAVVRYPALTSLGLSPDDLEGADLTMNGGEWTVKSWFPRPAPSGERDGEIYMILMEGDPEFAFSEEFSEEFG